MCHKFLILASILLLSACSGQIPDTKAVSESIKNIMPAKFEVISVTPLKEVPGLIEVAVKMDKQPVILYMDTKAQYVLSGSLIQVESKKNLTIEAQAKIK